MSIIDSIGSIAVTMGGGYFIGVLMDIYKEIN